MRKQFVSVILSLGIVSEVVGCSSKKSEILEFVKKKMNITDVVEDEASTLPKHLFFDMEHSPYLIHDKTNVLEVIKDVSAQYGLKDVEVNPEECQENKILDSTFYSFAQTYKGIPVYGRKIIVCVDDDGQLQGMSNNYISLDNMDMSEKISEVEAKKIVEKQYGEEVHICNDGKTIYSLYGTEPTLVWQFYVNGSTVSETCFVDTDSGNIVATFSDILADTGIYEDENGRICFNTKKTDMGTYLLIDEKRNLYVYDSQNQTTKYAMVDEAGNVYYYNNDNDMWYDDSESEVMCVYEEATGKWDIRDTAGNIIGKNGEQVIYTNDVFEPLNVISNDSTSWSNGKAAKALSLVESTYDFFETVLERQGYDRKNGRTNIYVNDGWDEGNNAYSHLGENRPPTVLAFGTNITLTADLVGHEFMHSVERTISGMIYQNESGALKEALADVFGELLEDWISDGELDDDCDWIQGERNMIDPSDRTIEYCYYKRNGLECPVYAKNKTHISGQGLKKPSWFSKGCCKIEIPYPDTYRNENYWTGSDDYGGCHINNTVISHACYLMTHPENGMGLTNEELAKLLYKTLGNLLPDCNFNTFATAVYDNAVRMHLVDEKIKTIERAFKQVGLKIEKRLVVKIDESQLSKTVHYKPELYEQIFEEYNNAINLLPEIGRQGLADEFPDVNEFLASSNVARGMSIWYGYYDIDGNGVEELFFSYETIVGYEYKIVDVFSQDGEQVQKIGEDNTFSEYTGSCVYESGVIYSSPENQENYYVLNDDGYHLDPIKKPDELGKEIKIEWRELKITEETTSMD